MAHPGPHLILVSGSPRRRELLLSAGYQPLVCPSDAAEDAERSNAQDQALAIASQKLDALWHAPAARRPPSDHGPWLAADTVVVLEGTCLGKPAGVAEAKAMLMALSGTAHEVVTGVVIRLGEHERAVAVTTRVTFRALSRQEIDRYVATGEPMDKAGAYGIQGHGGALVDTVYGSYTNVVGLPLRETIAALTAVCEAASGP